MKASAQSVPTSTVPGRASGEPALPSVLLIFWAAFAGAVIVTRILNPAMFAWLDPDSLLRLVQVRDLLAGQEWFDLVQHRMDPPAGILMHWSRLIDAPLTGLVLLGNLFGDGEAFALTAWPLLLLLGLMAAAMYVGTALAGRAAAVPTLILSLFFFSPLLLFLPGRIDHHNAQLVLMMATLAVLSRLGSRPVLGFAAGLGCAIMLAIGLEMLPYVAAFGAVIALRWAATGDRSRGTALFGIAFGAFPTILYVLAGSPAAAMACDSLSWVYVAPAAIAGFGLAALAVLCRRTGGVILRLCGLVLLGAICGTAFVVMSPECLVGPLGFLTPELKALWLDNVTEAQPLLVFFAREPAGIVATFGPPLVALAVALSRVLSKSYEGRDAWILPVVLIAVALAMSFHQVRTLPYANAVAIPILGAWLAELRARHRVISLRPLKRAMPVVLAVLLAMPFVHLAVGRLGVRVVSLATAGRIAVAPPPETADAAFADLSPAASDCIDPASAALFSQVPEGLVLAPIFYGSSVLALSEHAVVAGPYHRGGPAILATIHAMTLAPDEARAIVVARGVEYVAICTSAREAAVRAKSAPDGLLSSLMSGERIAWLEPVQAGEGTMLRLWRVRD